jgi:2-aminoadipate transaminase
MESGNRVGTSAVQAERQARMAAWARGVQRSTLQECLAASGRPGVTSFALGLPSPDLFPVEALTDAAARVLSGQPGALQYSPPLQSLKRHIASLMIRRGVRCSEDDVFLTSGAQQGMSLALRVLTDPGDLVATEALTYPGFLQLVSTSGAVAVAVPSGDELDLGALHDRLVSAQRPSVLYVMADGHNPRGVSMSVSQRRQLVDMAARQELTIIEDDVYGLFQYEEPTTALRAFSDAAVVHVGSFSKVLAPSLRTGWIIAPRWMHSRLSVAKETSDIDTATFSQRLVVSLLDQFDLDEHVRRVTGEYRRRRDAMLEALARYFPAEARWRVPSAGFYIWVELSPRTDTSAMLADAVARERVSFVPGEAFMADRRGPGAQHCMRLNYSHCPLHLIDDGIARLARAVRRGLS